MSSSVAVQYARSPSIDDVMIVDFSNGTLKRGVDQDSIRFACCKDVKRQKVHPVAQTPHMTYVPDAVPQRKFCKYMVGVRDKKTNTLQVYDASIFHLKPKTDVTSVEDEDNTDMTFIQKNDMLTMSFGSSKKKKSVTSRLNNAIQGETLNKAVSASVEHALSRTNVDEEVDKTNQESDILPKCNMDAMSPEEAYRLDGLISQSEMDALDSLANEVTTPGKTDISTITKSKYITDHMEMLPVTQKSKIHRVKCLLYLSYMIEMYGFKQSDWKRKECFSSDLPDEIKRNLLQAFSQKIQQVKGFSRTRSPRLKDKLAAYVIVLMLHIDEFDLAVDDVQVNLKLGQQKLMTLLRCLGCNISKSSDDRRRIGLKCPVVITQPTPSKRKGPRS